MADTTKMSAVAEAKTVVLHELGNETTQNELVQTVFKGLDVPQMKRAVLEGHLRGFTFKDFLEKNVYAIKYGGGYSLVTGVDFNRKLGMKGGIVGTEAPQYETETDDDGKTKIISCSVTVNKLFDGGHVGNFTATVYFEEFYKAGREYNGKYTPSMWDKMPRVMIAKVAEMHALRKACPDELSQSYIEEEMNHNDVVVYEVSEPDVDKKEIAKVVKKISTFRELPKLQAYYTELGKPMNMVQDVIDAYENVKNKLSDSE
jgi:hypothetical protein